MRVLYGEVRVGLLPILPAVAGAFDEHHARNRWHRLEVFEVEHQRLADHAVHQHTMLGRIEVGRAGVAALVVQIRWRDAADQLVERRLRIDRVARINIALARSSFGNPGDFNVFRTLAVPAKIGSRLAGRHVGKGLGGRLARDNASRKARGGRDETPARQAAVPAIDAASGRKITLVAHPRSSSGSHQSILLARARFPDAFAAEQSSPPCWPAPETVRLCDAWQHEMCGR